jgi:hypothetical protein
MTMLNTHCLKLVALKDVPTRAVRIQPTKLMLDVREGRIILPDCPRTTNAAALAQVLGGASKIREGYWTAVPPCHTGGRGVIFLQDLDLEYVRIHCGMCDYDEVCLCLAGLGYRAGDYNDAHYDHLIESYRNKSEGL